MFELGVAERAHEKLGAKTKRRWSSIAPSLVTVLLASVVAAACSTSTAPTPQVSATRYLDRSGVGNLVLPPVALLSKGTVTWRFNCQDPSTRRPFAITATERGGSPVTVTHQTGLGGGGYKSFKTSGTFTFTIKTSCNWNVTVGTKKAGAPSATTTPVKE
jgi:hypothetical protein